MRKKLGTAVAVAAMSAFVVAPSGASAAHCQNPEKTSPGFSYFGNDHVQESDHAEGKTPGHGGTPGASNCRETTGSPSERAPGRNS